jgi:hypothetical protein
MRRRAGQDSEPEYGDDRGYVLYSGHRFISRCCAAPLSRHIFKAPTRFYKTGVVLMAWLNGHQDGLLRDPELSVARMRRVMATYGIEG